jgi:hypothetical protein
VSAEDGLRRQSLLYMWAQFGWPAGWKADLRRLALGAGPDLLKACVEAGKRLSAAGSMLARCSVACGARCAFDFAVLEAIQQQRSIQMHELQPSGVHRSMAEWQASELWTHWR